MHNMVHYDEACKLELAADLVDADCWTRRHLAALLLLHDTSTREQRQPHHTEYLVANTDGMSSYLVAATVITLDGYTV